MYMCVRMLMCVHVFVHMSVPQCTHAGQRSICGSWFFLSTMWVQGPKSSPRVWGGTFSCGVTPRSPTPDSLTHLILHTSPFLSPRISHYSGKFDFMNG